MTERRQRLARSLAGLTPQQPATVFWRAIELDRLLDHDLPDGLGLDVGCGDGSLIRVLREHGVGWRLVGIDPDPAETELARQSGVYERVHTASATEIPEADAVFDFAFSNSVLEHVPELPQSLRQIARVLKPGGRLIATVPTASLNECLRGPGLLAPLLGRTRAEYLERIDQRTAHVNLWEPPQWEEELLEAGFEDVGFTPYLSEAETRRWERLSNWTGGIAFAISGEKPIEVSRRVGVSTAGRFAPLLRAPAKAVTAAALRRSNGGAPNACVLIDAKRALMEGPA